MSFMDDLEIETSTTLTENDGRELSTTGDKLLNLFAVLGALRTHPIDVIDKFDAAYRKNADLATKMAFYGRDVRGGLGERTVGRFMLRELALLYPEVVVANFKNIVKFGRYDDLFVLFDTFVETDMIEFVKMKLVLDYKFMKSGQQVSLLAKWMPSINASSEHTKALAHRFVKAFNTTPREYRKTLSALRKYIDVTEVKMSANKWTDIDYKAVPSNAMSNYGSAFARHDCEGFTRYMDAVKSGDVKINAATLYPYNVIETLERGTRDVAEAQWNALPNYVEGDNNFLIMADVSGSMTGRPMHTSVGLAIYFAERNHGAFANKFMTFTDIPQIVEVTDGTLYEKYRSVTRHVGYNTNLEAAFGVILSTAVRTKCPQADLPKALVIISDMEIDHWNGGSLTFTEEMRNRFADAGYEMPKLVYWNVDSRKNTFLASKNDPNALLVSGQSASTFKNLIKGIDLSAFEIMVQTLNDPRYDCIVVPSQL